MNTTKACARCADLSSLAVPDFLKAAVHRSIHTQRFITLQSVDAAHSVTHLDQRSSQRPNHVTRY
ncbi:hypothetical protein, partial [Xanthomonas vasicola]